MAKKMLECCGVVYQGSGFCLRCERELTRGYELVTVGDLRRLMNSIDDDAPVVVNGGGLVIVEHYGRKRLALTVRGVL